MDGDASTYEVVAITYPPLSAAISWCSSGSDLNQITFLLRGTDLIRSFSFDQFVRLQLRPTIGEPSHQIDLRTPRPVFVFALDDCCLPPSPKDVRDPFHARPLQPGHRIVPKASKSSCPARGLAYRILLQSCRSVILIGSGGNLSLLCRAVCQWTHNWPLTCGHCPGS